ncbi:hypothetical protein NDY24_21255 [Xanthomonas hortorum pv. pelargonii]|nr:hypothetical protein NDY24_21255 [Xanthomonas hortorum pv. pelargonii]
MSQLSPMLGSTRTAWSRLLGVMGSHAPALRRCPAGLVAAAVLQGLALACVFPLLAAVFPAPDQGRALGWLAAMTVLAGIATVLRWRAQGFEYGGRLAQVTTRCACGSASNCAACRWSGCAKAAPGR